MSEGQAAPDSNRIIHPATRDITFPLGNYRLDIRILRP